MENEGDFIRRSFWAQRWVLISIPALNPGLGGWTLADFGVLFFPAIVAGRESFAINLLGFCHNMCLERSYQEFDWPGVSVCGNWPFPSSVAQPSTFVETAAGFKLASFPCDCSSVAHFGGDSESAQGTVRGFLWFYFVNEQFMRYVNKRVPPGYDTVPLFIFWGLVLVWMIPWTVFLPEALGEIPRVERLAVQTGRTTAS